MDPDERFNLLEAWIEWGLASTHLARKLGMLEAEPAAFRAVDGPLGVLLEEVQLDRQGMPEDPLKWERFIRGYEKRFAAIDMQPVIDYVKAHTPSP